MSSTGVTSTENIEPATNESSAGINDLPLDVFILIKRKLPIQSLLGKNSINLVCKRWDSRIKQDTLYQLRRRKYLESLTFSQFLTFTRKFPTLLEIVQTHNYQIKEDSKNKGIGRLIMTAERQCLHLVDDVMKQAAELHNANYATIMSGDDIAHPTKPSCGATAG